MRSPSRRLALLPLLTGLAAFGAEPAAESPAPSPPPHVVVAREAGKFLGWPANHGPLRVWGDELLVAFLAAEHVVDDTNRHTYDRTKPMNVWLARSLDGGRHWTVEKPDALHGHKNLRASAVEPPHGGIDGANPDCVVHCGYEDEAAGRTWFQVSPDRGHTWGARQALPDFGLTAVNGRTDYVLEGPDAALFLFVTPSAHEPREGRVFAGRTRDGGRTWTRLGWVGSDFTDGFSIQPATLRLGPQSYVTATRWQRTGGSGVEIHRSDDGGTTWRTLGNAAETGPRSTAADLIGLRDGRLALVYAQRHQGRIAARISADQGRSWSGEITIRDGGTNWDIGYPRLAQRSDGRLVAVYYWNDGAAEDRYLAATLWEAPSNPAATH